MVDFGVKVQLVPFQIADQGIFFTNELIESFDFLCQHDNFVFEVLDFHLNISVLIKSLFKIGNFGFVGLDLIVIVSQGIIKSLDFLTQLLILPVYIDISRFLFFEGSQLLLKFGVVEF